MCGTHYPHLVRGRTAHVEVYQAKLCCNEEKSALLLQSDQMTIGMAATLDLGMRGMCRMCNSCMSAYLPYVLHT